MRAIEAILIIAVAFGVAGCAQSQPTPIEAMTADQADCYSRAAGAGSGIGGSSLLFQLAFQNEAQVAVYRACMQSKGLTPHGTAINTPSADEFLGMTLRPSDGGIEVHAIDPRGSAFRQGLRQHDRITRIGNTPVTSAEQLKSMLDRHRRIGIRVERSTGGVDYLLLRL